MKRSVISVLKKRGVSNRQKATLRLLHNAVTKPLEVHRNINRYRYDINSTQTTHIEYKPPVFVATIIDNCNLRCPTCLYLLEDSKKFKRGHITPSEFLDVLERYNSQKTAEVIFLTGGEPLLHPNLEELIDICKEFEASVKLSTNGILLKDTVSTVSKLDYINISVDAWDEKSYKEYRGGTPKQWKALEEGLYSLKETESHFSLSFLLTADNLPKVEGMLEFSEKVGPHHVSFHNINPHGCEEYRPLTVQNHSTNEFLDKTTARRDYPFDIYLPVIFDTESPQFLNSKCIQPWYYFAFNHRGDVSMCCHLAHEPEIGNVFKGYDFNSERILNIRKDIINGVVEDSCLYCQRRFMGKEFGEFSSKNKKWYIHQNLGLVNS